MPTHLKRILRALMRKRGLTTQEASDMHLTTTLHRRLADLEALGVRIIRRQIAGTQCKRYFAINVPAWMTEKCK